MHTFFPMSHVNKKTICELFPSVKKIGFFTIFSLNLLQALCFGLLRAMRLRRYCLFPMITFHNLFITNSIFESLIDQLVCSSVQTCFPSPLRAMNVKMKVYEKIMFKREEEEEEERQKVKKACRELELRHGIWAWKLVQNPWEWGVSWLFICGRNHRPRGPGSLK